jgi:lysosomal-associated membrane protein 1/2
MKILFAFLFVTLCAAVLSQSTSDSNTTQDTTITSTTPVPDTTTTTEVTTPTTDVTTPATDVTTSSAAPTPTKAPKTTTTASSTTGQPVTTSSPVTVAPEPEKCLWNVTQPDVTCMRVQLQAQFIILNEDKKFYINLGCNASSTNSDCSSSNVTQTLVLSETDHYTLEMVFEKDSDKFSVRNITLSYVLPDGEKGFVSNDSDKLFNVKVGNSYLCRSDIKVHLGNVTMEISEIHVQAFGAKDNENFGSAEECEADEKVSDVVPIAVGVALAALIIIVLIAYLVGRRRSRQRGYQSV